MNLKNIFFGAVFILSSAQLCAQNCVRLIRTQHDNPTNDELATYFPGKVNPWLNTFDFAKIGGAGFSDIILNPTAGWVLPGFTGGTLSLVSPFSSSMGTEYQYLQQPTLGAPAQKDIHWEDGWELMWMNTGYYPNGEPLNFKNPNRILTDPLGLANARVPYIILYNRYTGKLRVFANLFTDFNQVDSVRMILGHPNLSNTKKTGIFRHLSGYDKTLDETTEQTFVSSINFHNKNNHRLWWSSDFQLGYDPCVCEHESQLTLDFKSVKDQNINLFGRIVGQQQNINAFDADFLTNESIEAAANSGSGGSLLFKSFGSLLDNYDKQLRDYDTRLQSFNSPMNQAIRQIILAAKNGVLNNSGAFVATAIGGIAVRALVNINGAASSDTTTAKKWGEEASKAVKGELGKALDMVVTGNFGKDFMTAPQRPTMPTASFSEMRLTGSITDVASIQVTNFLTPGTYKYPQDLTPQNYPAYNNAVGLFALLRKPRINKLFTNSLTKTLTNEFITAPQVISPANPMIVETIHVKQQTWKQDYKLFLRFKEPLKYKLNRALDFDDIQTKVYASFVVELENKLQDSTCFNNFHVENQSDNLFVRNAFPPVAGEPYKIVLESKWQNVYDIGEVLFDGDFSTIFNTEEKAAIWTITDDNGHSTTQQGEFLTCFNGPDPLFKIKQIKMKVAADMYFNQLGSNGLQNSTFQSFTYLLFNDSLDINLFDTTSDLSKLTLVKQPLLVLTNETIETTDPFVFKTDGTTIYVNAEQIELNGNIDVQTGYKAELHATKSIRFVSGNTNISNKIRFKNVAAFSNFGKNPETSQSEIEAFCQDQNNGYKALQTANKTDEESSVPETEEPIAKIETKVYPNPASNVVSVSIETDEEKEYTFQVYDLMGRVLINETLKGANQPLFEITTDQLANGTYLLRINSQDGAIAETHRIVILK